MPDIRTVVSQAERRAKERYPDKAFDDGALKDAKQFAPFYGTGIRVKVEREYANGEKWVRHGTVSMSTGWKPVFLLMHQRNHIGSSDVLSSRDRIVAIKRPGGYYQKVV